MASRDVTIRISATDNFSSVMTKYNQEMAKAEDNTKKTSKSSDDLSKTLKGLFTLALAQQVAGYVSEMVSLGREANATEDRFRALTSTMGDYESTMAGLRSATLGAVDDMALQQGAMLLVQTANIETNDELERMMRLITMTKKPSEDMTTAIQNFGLMLANNSILRLDSFGISASKVRARIIQLQETMGLDRSEAFRMAVLEEGEKNIKKFGDAADAASTSLSRLQVTATNAVQDIAQQAAAGAEGFALAIEYMLGATGAQQARQKEIVDETAISMALDFQEAFAGAMAMDTFGTDQNFISSFVKESLALSISDPSLMQDMDAFMSKVFQNLGATTSSEMLPVFRSILEQTLQIQNANQSERNMAKEVLATQEQIADVEAERAENAQRVLSFTDQMTMLNERNSRAAAEQYAIEQRLAGQRAQYMGQLGETGQSAFSAAFQYNTQSYGDTGVPQYMTEGQADQVRSAADQARMLADNMAAAAEAEEGLFTDEQVERADAYASRLEDMADNAQDAADAFANMSLSEMLGQGDGGRLAEEMDAVIEKMKELGAETWEIQNAQRAFDLRTGRESALSLAFEDQIVAFNAQVYEQQGADAAVAFMSAYDQTLEQARLMGIDMNDPAFVGAVTQTFTNPLDTANFDIQGFLSGFAPAATASTDIATNLEAAGTVSGDLTTNMEVATASGEAFSGYMLESNKQAEGVVGHVKTISEELDKVSKTTTKIPVELEWVNVGGLLALILPGLVQMVQGAGGVMPGTDSRASTSGALVRQGNAN